MTGEIIAERTPGKSVKTNIYPLCTVTPSDIIYSDVWQLWVIINNSYICYHRTGDSPESNHAKRLGSALKP